MSVAIAAPPVRQELDRRRMNLIFVTVMLGLLISALDQTIVATALPTIVGDLGGAEHALGSTGLVLAVSWGGTQYPWDSTTILGLFAGSAVALALPLVAGLLVTSIASGTIVGRTGRYTTPELAAAAR